MRRRMPPRGPTMMPLSQYVEGRDNNFNLLRVVAAFLVLFSHSFPLSTGHVDSEPLRQWLGITPGSIAVDIFFVTSGFLVTGSLIKREGVRQFLWARALRIYPALWVAVALTTLAVGACFTSWHPLRFAQSVWTWEHVLRNSTLLFGVSYQLPGAFEHVPYATAVNGSLWTLPYELRMYGLLALLWLGVRGLGLPVKNAFTPVVVAVALAGLCAHLAFPDPQWEAAGLLYMFFVGGALYALRAHVPMSWPIFAVSVALIVLSAWATVGFVWAYALLLPYVVMFLALVPAGPIRRFNRLGDYSYGIYVYAFPVQQATMALRPGTGQMELLALSSAITLVLAVASWHWIEKRALALKERVPR